MTWCTDEYKKRLERPVLVIGAGGIGCELLKNLVLSGFKTIEVIDLDTIDVSNLNRQFLFRKEHVGKSKAEVASAAARAMCPGVDIKHYHDSVLSDTYDIKFFGRFMMVISALDNKKARYHVNRMCLAARVPLVESGTAGYLGQLSVVVKGKTACYECEPQVIQKSFPGCTIRNTPSEPIHCIVWAKHLFNLLFGEHDPDDDISPELESAGTSSSEAEAREANKISTRKWAEDHDYELRHLFDKLFSSDIKFLASLTDLWKDRRKPQPVSYDQVLDQGEGSSGSSALKSNEVWSLRAWVNTFDETLANLRQRMKTPEGEPDKVLIWDKDDEDAMKFVAAAANIRSSIFAIPLKSLFDVKSMAGNIIPAIATTNAIIAAMVVVEALKIANSQFDDLKTIFINSQPNFRGKLFVDTHPQVPQKKCYVCSDRREVAIKLNVNKMTVKQLETKIIKEHFCFVQPDVMETKSFQIVISSDGDTEALMCKKLSEMGISGGSQLEVDDFVQQFGKLYMNIVNDDELDEDDFDIVDDTGDTEETRKRRAEEGATSMPKRVRVDGETSNAKEA
ncbi:hypothetical protein QR680_010350 [Steinernema hermaphroditum]|uniref:SUMO-activating enzyme subunit n=1 Tax=Steinernema hermaphroditum TaxID=289476 RepID=A0AA39IQ41_9BILA|nr:hypothetical protein QR680_010350 [Steinernema hermaphroditum]